MSPTYGNYGGKGYSGGQMGGSNYTSPLLTCLMTCFGPMTFVMAKRSPRKTFVLPTLRWYKASRP